MVQSGTVIGLRAKLTLDRIFFISKSSKVRVTKWSWCNVIAKYFGRDKSCVGFIVDVTFLDVGSGRVRSLESFNESLWEEIANFNVMNKWHEWLLH